MFDTSIATPSAPANAARRVAAASALAIAACLAIGARAVPAPSAVIEPLPGLRLRWVPAAPPAIRTGFYLGETEVPQALWRALMRDDPSVIRGFDLPVERITWEQATAFARALRERTGLAFRLPTEAEWERAATVGDDDASRLADAARAAAYVHHRATAPVATCSANAWGLRGMHDNVWEWCADRLGPDGSRHVLKGGTCNMYPRWCAVTDRTEYPAGFTHERRGLRLALTP